MEHGGVDEGDVVDGEVVSFLDAQDARAVAFAFYVVLVA
jgi:hypothetical protein